MAAMTNNVLPNFGGLAFPTIKPKIDGFGEITYGAKYEMLGGGKYEFAAGAKMSFFLGMENKTSYGSKFDISGGSEIKITTGPEWTSKKAPKWHPVLRAKYDFSTIKEHKLAMASDGSTDILVKKTTLAKNSFLATAGYGAVGELSYTAYTKIFKTMLKTIVWINGLTQFLTFSNALSVNPAVKNQDGYDFGSQLRTNYIPILTQIATTIGSLYAALTVVAQRDSFKKTINPKSVLQLTNGDGAFLGSGESDVLSGVEVGKVITLGAVQLNPVDVISNMSGRLDPFKVSDGVYKGFKYQFGSYFSASNNKAVTFSKAIEIHACDDQNKKIPKQSGSLTPPGVVIKATGDNKAAIVCESKTIELRTETPRNAVVKLILSNEKKSAKLTVDRNGKTGMFLEEDQFALHRNDGGLILKRDKVYLTKRKSGQITIQDSMVTIQSKKNNISISSQGAKINGNLIVMK